MNAASSIRPETIENQPLPSSASRLLMRIVSISTGISFGAGMASVQALRYTSGGFSFAFSAWTVAAFAVGFLCGIAFWRLVAGDRSGVWKGSLLILVMGAGMFLYPLRYVQARLLPEVAFGLVAAVSALSILGFLTWQVKRYFDADERENK